MKTSASAASTCEKGVALKKVGYVKGAYRILLRDASKFAYYILLSNLWILPFLGSWAVITYGFFMLGITNDPSQAHLSLWVKSAGAGLISTIILGGLYCWVEENFILPVLRSVKKEAGKLE